MEDPLWHLFRWHNIHSPSDTFDIIEWTHSVCLWVCFISWVSNTIHEKFHVVDWLELTSKFLWVVIHLIQHLFLNLYKVIVPRFWYFVKCEFFTNSPIIFEGWHLLGSVLRVQFTETFRKGLNTQIGFFPHFHNFRIICGKVSRTRFWSFYYLVPLIWEDTDTNLIKFVSTMLRNFWGFGVLSDAYGNVFFRDEINETFVTLKGDKLTGVKSFHVGRIASVLIIHYRRIIFSYCLLS